MNYYQFEGNIFGSYTTEAQWTSYLNPNSYLNQSSHEPIIIHLKDKELQDKQVIPLAKVLQGYQCDVKIDLSGNHITDKGAQALAEALGADYVVKAYSFFIPIIQLFKTIPPIVSIDLSNNEIGNEGAKALAQALRVNQYLGRSFLSKSKALNLSNNKIGKEGVSELIKALFETNRHYNCLAIDGCVFSAEDLKEMESMKEYKEFERQLKEEEKFKSQVRSNEYL